MPINEQIKQIKNRIMYLRDVLDITIDEMASQLGITTDQYIQYESGETDIPAGIIYGIASIFEIDVTEILTGESPRMVDYTITRKNKGILVERYQGYSFEALAHNYIGRNKEPMLVTIKSSKNHPALVSHSGQEFNYVLEGSIAVIIGSKTLTLVEGDCIYFNPEIPHGQYALTDEAKFLTLIDN